MGRTQRSDHEWKKLIDILVTASGCLIDAPLLALDRNHAITRTHCFLCPSINHSTHKTKNVTQKAGREGRHGERSCELGLITAKVPEEE